MAEEVQRTLDAMVPALNDLQERGVFTRAEIHAIVNRRRLSEYATRRRQPRKADYLRYIRDEMNLEQLRKLRVNRIARLERQKKYKNNNNIDNNDDDDDDQHKRSSKHIGDKHIVQHIHLLWTRTLRKYRDDLSLVREYAAYCQQVHATRALSALYGRALRLHPHAVDLWIEAASHEFFRAGSISSARTLLQQALRVNNQTPASAQTLWLQLFALELHFATKMRGRQDILLKGSGSDGNHPITKKADVDSDTTEQDRFQIAKLVYQQALLQQQQQQTNHTQNKHDDHLVRFLVKFWDLCKQFPATQTLRHEILQSILQHCGNDTEAWLAWALFAWEQEKEHQENAEKSEKHVEKKEEKDEKEKENEEKEEDDDGHGEKQKSKKDDKEGGDDDGDDDNVNKNETDKVSSPQGFFPARDTAEEEEGEPAEKKQKLENGQQSTADVSKIETVLSILQQALTKIDTEEMYLKATRMVNRYIDDLQTRDNNNNKSKTMNAADDDKMEEAVDFLESILTQAASKDFYSVSLVREHAIFWTRSGQKDKAVACLEQFIQDHQNSKDYAGMASVWVHLAELSSESKEAVSILEKASRHIPPDQKEHFQILLRLLGAEIMSDEGSGNERIFALFERIILLAPGFKESLLLPEKSFGIVSLAHACLQYLQFARRKCDTKAAQKVYHTVLYKSTIAKTLLEVDEDNTIEFFSAAADIERYSIDGKDKKKQRKNIGRLYDAIIGLLGTSALADDFRQQKCDDLIRVSSYSPRTSSIPTLNARARDFDASKLADAFKKYRVVHLTNANQSTTSEKLTWKQLGDLYQSLDAKDKESWCIETKDHIDKDKLTPESFLAPTVTRDRAYSSFVVQKDAKAYQKTEACLPVAKLPEVDWPYEPALWIFFGRNRPGNDDLPGRPDHTDSISADGTWHFQLSGQKKWTIRPTAHLLKRMSRTLSPADFSKWDSNSRVEITCRQGDILIINTRLWSHQTHIPPQPMPSVSYARDFWCGQPKQKDCVMSNVDGLYATADIDEGTVLFTEKDMPDCALHRSSENPNCELVELDDGQMAIVSRRPIQSGEFFCVAESDDENDNDEGEDEEEEEEVEEGDDGDDDEQGQAEEEVNEDE